ncbi:unnamed protein product, partial [Mesorhabditis spiculigera]
MAYVSDNYHELKDGSCFMEVSHAPSTSTVYYTSAPSQPNGTRIFYIAAPGTLPPVAEPANDCAEAEFLNITSETAHQPVYHEDEGYDQAPEDAHQPENAENLPEDIDQPAIEVVAEVVTINNVKTAAETAAGLRKCKVEFIGNSTRKRKLHFKCEICQLKTGLALEVPPIEDTEHFERLVATIFQDGSLGWDYNQISTRLAGFSGQHICGFHAPGYWTSNGGLTTKLRPEKRNSETKKRKKPQQQSRAVVVQEPTPEVKHSPVL